MDLPQKTDELVEKCYKLPGVNHVYFEPPEDLRMQYPCIRIKRVNADSTYASNKVYKIDDRYDLIYITREPDSTLVHDILWTFEKVRHTRSYTANNLRHEQYTLFY